MIKEYVNIFRRAMVLVDLCLIAFIFIFSYWMISQYSERLLALDFYIWLCPVVVLSWAVPLYMLGMYRSFRLKSVADILGIVIKSTFIAFVLFGAVMYAFKIVNISRIFVSLVFGLTTLFLSLEKLVLLLFFKEIRRQGFNFRNVLVIGTNKRAQRFMLKMDSHRDLGLKVAGVLDEDPSMVGQKIYGHEIIGTFNDLATILDSQVIDQVVIIVPRSTLDRIEPLVLHCETLGVTVSVGIDLFNPKFTVGQEENVLGTPLITFRTVSNKLGQLILKRSMDILISGVWLFLTWPIYLIVSILIRATTKGPVFFTQERCGLQGRKFKLYKFRTMVADAEDHLESLMDKNEMQGPIFKIKNDPRITPIGKFLRKWSIDEFPQFWNVLCGEMSLVGPRPPMPREVNLYDYWQKRRLVMRPGITGLWQVSGRNNISNFDDWVKLDLQYIDHWSLNKDLKILVQTIPAVLKGTGAR